MHLGNEYQKSILITVNGAFDGGPNGINTVSTHSTTSTTCKFIKSKILSNEATVGEDVNKNDSWYIVISLSWNIYICFLYSSYGHGPSVEYCFPEKTRKEDYRCILARWWRRSDNPERFSFCRSISKPHQCGVYFNAVFFSILALRTHSGINIWSLICSWIPIHAMSCRCVGLGCIWKVTKHFILLFLHWFIRPDTTAALPAHSEEALGQV